MSLALRIALALNISLDPFFNSIFSHNHCPLSVGFIVQLLGCTAPHPFDSPPQRLVSDFVIASLGGAKQSSDRLQKIASSGKERPSRNDKRSMTGVTRSRVRVA